MIPYVFIIYISKVYRYINTIIIIIMNIELIIIKYLLDKDIYNKYNIYLSRDYLRANYPEIYKILLVLDILHKKQDDLVVYTVDDLRALFFSQFPGLKRTEAEAINGLFDQMVRLDISKSVVESVLESHRMRSAAFEVASKGYEVSEGKGSFSDLLDTFNRYSGDFKPEATPVEFVTDSLDELKQATFAKPGVKWRLKTLRKMMGSLRKGDMGFIFARPEVGKTTFLADQGSYFAHQLDGPYLHFNNEEYGPKVKIRYYQAALGLTNKQLFTDIRKHEKEFLDFTHGNVKIYDAATITKNDCEAICEKIQPKFIVFDSIDKLKGFEDDRDDLIYKQIYAWAREMSKTYGPVIGVCHASVSAEKKAWLEMDDVAYAKTAKQGEADWILGIGSTFQQGAEFIRHFHLPKNKLMGDNEFSEMFRHGKLDVMIHPEIAQYQDILEFDDD